MRKLIVKLPDNRDYAGTLHLEDEHGAVLIGPFLVCGRADRMTAQHHGNPACDPLLPFGNTPLGRYRLEGIAASGPGTGLPVEHFGPHGVLVLRPAAGSAALADANGRFYLFIQGGRTSSHGRLRPTNGSLRLANRDQERLVRILRKCRDVMCECRRMPRTPAKNLVAVNSPCSEGDPPRSASFPAWTNQQILSRSVDDADPDQPSHPEGKFGQRFAPPLFRLFASGGGGGGSSGGGNGYGQAADDLTARATELAGTQQYDKDPDGQTHCSEFVRDFVGKDLPELQGQAKDQVDQLSQAQDWKQLAYDKDPQLALRQAQLYANQGKTVIIAWKNPEPTEGNTGHIAVVVPSLPDEQSHDGMFPSGQWGLRVPYIAQAGDTVSAKIAMSYGFSAKNAKSGLQIFVRNS